MRSDTQSPTMPIRPRARSRPLSRRQLLQDDVPDELITAADFVVVDQQKEGMEYPPSPPQRTASSKRRREDPQQQQLVDSSARKREAKRSAVAPKRVSFELDNRRRIKTHTRTIQNRLDFEAEEVELLWWKSSELKAIMEREQDVFEVFSKCCSSYIETVLRVWDRCKDTDSKQSEVIFSFEDIEKISSAPARGMENDVVISVVPGFREDAIKSVLKTQRDMANANSKVRSFAMKRKYRTYSQASLLFAKTIADGDAQVAAAIYQQ